MAKKGLPKQGAKAILDSWADANEMILKQEKQKKENERQISNEEFKKFLKKEK